MHQHTDRFQGTTLAHRLQASVASVVETSTTLVPRGGMHFHSLMNALDEGICLLTLPTCLDVDAILRHTVYTLGYRTPGAMEKVQELVGHGAMLIDIRTHASLSFLLAMEPQAVGGPFRRPALRSPGTLGQCQLPVS